MRIVGGKNRGRILISPQTPATRPTGDKVRQAVFNILAHAGWLPSPLPDGALVLDAFAGTGALGVEALSRGAAHCVFMDTDAAALGVCKKNVALIGAEERGLVLRHDALKPGQAKAPPRNLIFLDPPYGKNMGAEALAALDENGWLADNCVAVMEMAKKEPEEIPEGWMLRDERVYGIALVRFLARG
jgi:16S rRNA (guanine966-N2)-methyltransferase